MAQPKVHLALAGLLAVGLVGCATHDDGRYSTNYPADSQPVSQSHPAGVQPQSQMIEGQVIRFEGDAYVIKEPSGQQTRILLDKNTVKENIAVGDYVVVRYDGSSSAYASSVVRRTGSMPPPSAGTLPRPQTVEGVVQRQEGNEYVIKDISGKEVRLRVDNMTQRDGNITAGDRVMAIVSARPSDASYATVYSVQSPYVFQGDVVRIDGNWYVVQDIMGKEVRVRFDNMTRRDGTITAGDRVVMFTNTMPSDIPYATTVYRYPSSNIIQGEVVRIDGNCYAVRDSTGRETCLYSNSTTVWNDRVSIGDRIIAYSDPTSAVHVDYIAKR